MQHLGELQQNLKEEKFDSAAKNIRSMHNNIKPEIFLKSSKNYNIDWFKEALETILPLTIHSNESLRERSDKFIIHWGSIFSSYTPIDYLEMCYTLAEKPELEHCLFGLLTPLTPAVSIISTEEKPRAFEACIKIIKGTDPKYLKGLPHNFWDFINQKASDLQIEDMMKLFFEINDLAYPMSLFIQHNPIKYFDQDLQNSSYQFLSLIIRFFPPTIEFDSMPIAARIAESLINQSNDVMQAIDIIPQLLRDPTNEEKLAYQPIWKALHGMLSSDVSPQEFTKIILVLHKAGKHKFFPMKELLQYMKLSDTDMPHARFASLEIGFDMLDVEEFRPQFFDATKSIALTRRNALFCCLIDHLPKYLDKMLEYDRDSTYLIIQSAIHPLPIDEYVPIFVVRFINSLTMEQIKEYGIHVGDFIEAYYKIPNDTLAVELKKLVNTHDFKFNLFQMDWFSAYGTLLQIIPDVCPPILAEGLELEMIHYSVVPYAIDLFKKHRCFQYFNDVLDFLKAITNEMGLSFEVASKWGNASMVSHYYKRIDSSFVYSILGRLVFSLLQALLMFLDFMKIEKEDSDSLRKICKFLAPMYCDLACAIMEKIAQPSNDEDFFQQFLPIGGAVFVARFAIKAYGIVKALELCRAHVIKSAAYDREIATEVANYLEQPLPPMPTFLSFVGFEKHAAWAEHCRETIDKDQWILVKGEEGYVPPPDNENLQISTNIEQIEKKKFVFQQVEPRKGIDGLFDGTMFSIISHFFYQNKELPDFNDNLEDFVLENSDDKKLVTGFFAYAYKFKKQINHIEKWTEILTDDDSLYSAGLFLSDISYEFDEIPQFMINFIMIHLHRLGYHFFRKEILVHAFQHEVSVNWFFIRAVISMDLKAFQDHPLIMAEFKEDKQIDLFKLYLDGLDEQKTIDRMMDVFVSLVSIFFKPDRFDEPIQFPSVHVNLCKLRHDFTLPSPVKIDQVILDSLFSTLERQKFFPLVFFDFFLHVKLSNAEFDRVKKLVLPKSSTAQRILRLTLPSLYFNDDSITTQLDEEATAFFSLKPPSFSRAFYRSLLCPFAPPISQNIIAEISKILTPVFPHLCYYGIPAWKESTLISKFLTHKISKKLLDKATLALEIPTYENLDLYEILMRLSDNEILKLNQSSRLEISRKFLISTVKNESSYLYAYRSFKLILSKIPLEQVANIVAIREFVNNSHNNRAMCLIFKMFENECRKADDQNLITLCEAFHDNTANIFKDKSKELIFLEIIEKKELWGHLRSYE